MAANFWVSTQRRHWMFTRERLAEIRENIKEKNQDGLQTQLPELRMINIVLKTGSCCFVRIYITIHLRAQILKGL